jgi:hypothetical protein
MDFTLTQEEYESLIKLARVGVGNSAKRLTELEQWLRLIEVKNGVTRSFVLVQWQELDSPLPAGTRFPTVWPPQLRKPIELISRPVARVDVEAVVAQYGNTPVDILVTRDPAGLVGWQTLDQFFLT